MKVSIVCICPHCGKGIQSVETLSEKAAEDAVTAVMADLESRVDGAVAPAVAKAVSKAGGELNHSLAMRRIIKKVSESTKIPEDAILGPSRRAEIVRARHLAMYVCRTQTGASWSLIGEAFGGRDHTTVINAVNKVSEQLKYAEGL